MKGQEQHTLPGFSMESAKHWSCRRCTGAVYQGERLTSHHWACGAACGETRQWHRRRCPDCTAVYDTRHRVDHREEHNAQGKQYYTNHRDEIKARHRQYRADHREELKAYQRHRRIEMPEAVRAVAHRVRINREWRYKSLVCADGFECWEAAEQAMVRQCVICGNTEDIHADHVTPLARGGPHCGSNCQPLCRFHNQSKGDKTMNEYLAWLDRATIAASYEGGTPP